MIPSADVKNPRLGAVIGDFLSIEAKSSACLKNENIR
jgi:hypothetical protein